jgi:hypothetical protein
MAAGIGLAILAFMRQTPGTGPFWGWMGAAFGCFFGGLGGVGGCWNTYRQMLGRRDLMAEPGPTPLDRILRWFTALGVLILLTAAIGWRETTRDTHLALLTMGGVVTLQGGIFLLVRRFVRATAGTAQQQEHFRGGRGNLPRS